MINKSYKIFWILNASIDMKVSISPRVEMLKELLKIGNEVVLITSYKNNKQELGVNTKYIKAINLPLLSRFYFYFKCFKKLENEIDTSNKKNILIADQNSLFIALIIKLKYKIIHRKEVYVHFDVRTIPVEIKGIKGHIDNILFWYPSLILAHYFANSRSYITSEIKKIANYGKKHCCVWSSGVNIEKFKTTFRDIDEKKIDKRVLFFHGVATPNRGIKETIIAVRKIKKIITNIEFIIVGDGPDLKNLKRYVEENELQKYVKFKGRVNYKNIQKYINDAELCICPLPDIFWWRVSSPLKVLEYLAMKKPIVLTEITPNKKLFDEKIEGIYWAGKGTPNEIAKAVLEAFNHDLSAIPKKQLRKIAEENTWRKKAEILIDYWNKFL